MTNSLAGPRRSSKAHPQNQTCTQKRSWSLFPGLLLIWSTTAFWLLVKPLNLRNMLSILMRCTEHCNTCIWHWLTGRTLFSTTIPDCPSHNKHLKSWMNWAMTFFLICNIHLTSHQPNTTSSSFLTTFCRENISTTSRRQKILSKSSSNPKAQISFFFLRNFYLFIYF